MTEPLAGLIPIVPTPFDDDGEVDASALERVLDYLTEVGVHGVAVLGMASEAITLTDTERDLVISTTAERVAGRLPIVAGCSHISPEAVAQLARSADRCGADALMVMPPSIGQPDRAALRDYFVAAADASDRPVMVQDNPGWHGVGLSLDLYAEIAAHPNIGYAKIETAHPPTTMTAVRAEVGDQLAVFGGQAGTWLPEELRRGIVGTMPASIMPQVYLQILQLWQQHRQQQALDMFDRYHPLIRVTSTPRIGIWMAKVVLQAAGVLDNAVVRSPFAQPTEADGADLQAVLNRLQIIDIMTGRLAP